MKLPPYPALDAARRWLHRAGISAVRRSTAPKRDRLATVHVRGSSGTMRMRDGAQRDCRHFDRARTAAYSRSLCCPCQPSGNALMRHAAYAWQQHSAHTDPISRPALAPRKACARRRFCEVTGDATDALAASCAEIPFFRLWQRQYEGNGGNQLSKQHQLLQAADGGVYGVFRVTAVRQLGA